MGNEVLLLHGFGLRVSSWDRWPLSFSLESPLAMILTAALQLLATHYALLELWNRIILLTKELLKLSYHTESRAPRFRILGWA